LDFDVEVEVEGMEVEVEVGLDRAMLATAEDNDVASDAELKGFGESIGLSGARGSYSFRIG
jgi:hypothetical protein